MKKNKIKILFINDTYQNTGGAEVYFFNLINHFSKNNAYDVYSMGFAEKERINEKVFIYKDAKLRASRYLQRIFGNPFLYNKLRSWIKNINPDIIHLNNINKATSSLLSACRGYKTIQTVHDYGIICPSLWCVYKDNYNICDGKIGSQCIKHKCISSRYYPFLLKHNISRNKMLKKQVSVFITAGETLKKYLLYNNFNNVVSINLPVDRIDIISEYKIEKGTILFVGALEANKGIRNLINCYKQIFVKNNNTKLVIIGTGSLEKELIKKVRILKLSKNILFLGKIPHSKINEYYKKANVVVIPSICQETFSYVTAEAMISGKPLVVSDRGELINLVKDSINGYIIHPTNRNLMAKKILKIINDEKIYKYMSTQSHKRAELLFNNNKHYQKLEKIYKNIFN